MAHTLPTHPIPTLSTHPINTSYQHTISTHPTDTTKNTTPCKQIPYQPPTNTPYQPPLLMYLHRTVGLRRLIATSPARYFPSPPPAGKALVGSSARATGGQLQKLGLGYKPTPGQGPGSDQEDDKRVDLRLGGRGLGDDVIKCVFQALSKARLIAYVRDIDVHANDLTCEGVVAMCDAFLGSSAGAGKGSRKGSRRLSQLSTGLGLGE